MLRSAAGLLAGVSLFISHPGAAQEPDSVESDRRCAVWAAIAAGSVEDPEARVGLTFALTWFLGRWEAATGRPFEEGVTAEYITSLEHDLQAVEKECLPKMEAFGARMTEWGQYLSAMATPPPV